MDTGNPSSANAQDSTARIHKVAVAEGVSKIDYMIMTHFHMDHFGGAADLAKRCRLEWCWTTAFPTTIRTASPTTTRGLQGTSRRIGLSRRTAGHHAVGPVDCVEAIQRRLPAQSSMRRGAQTIPGSGRGLTNGFIPRTTQHAVDTTDNANSILMC